MNPVNPSSADYDFSFKLKTFILAFFHQGMKMGSKNFLMFFKIVCTIVMADLKFHFSLIVTSSLNLVKQKSKGF